VKNKIIPVLSLCFLMGIFTLPVLAQDITMYEGDIDENVIAGWIETIADWIFTILVAVAVIMVLLAGFKWMISGGNEDDVATARKMLIWALIGVAIAILAKALVYMVDNLLF
jgi:FtsH-binding integral membrane protein